MISVSENYNPYSDARKTTLSVVFKLVDIDAKDHASAAATSEAEISKIEQTYNEVISMTNKIGTLEHNQVLLDGSWVFPDEDDNGQVGWWSEALSDASGEFTTPQVLEFNFTGDESSVGFTIFFDGKADEYPTDFTVETLDSTDTLISSETVTGNTETTYISEASSDGYRKLKLTFNKTSKPYRRVRVCGVIFGIIQTFDETNTKELDILYELSPTMESLPTNEMIITIDNTDRKYNLINPNGLYAYLQDGQSLDVKIGINGEDMSMGKFYFTKSSAEDSSMTASITANDKIYTLDGSICRIGEDGTWTVAEAVAAVISDSGLDITTSIPTDIGSQTINKCIPQDTTHREALRLIAQASMSVCYFDRTDTLVFVELVVDTVSDTFDNDNMITVPTVSVIERINTVEIVSNNEYTDVETIYTDNNKTSSETDKVLSIDNPLVCSSDVATWMLGLYAKRVRYETNDRGNPALELTDTITINDAYDENDDVVITRQEYKFDGGLKATTKGRVV